MHGCRLTGFDARFCPTTQYVRSVITITCSWYTSLYIAFIYECSCMYAPAFIANLPNHLEIILCSLYRMCSGYCGGILASIVAVAGAIMDSIGYDVVKVLDTCASDDGIYGDFTTSAVSQVMDCRAVHENWDCTCINVHQNGYCYSYNLVHDKQNCEQILGTYTELMNKSVKCLGFLVGFSIFYCFYLCALTMCAGACSQFCCEGVCVNYDAPRGQPLAQQQYCANSEISYPQNHPQLAVVVSAEPILPTAPPAPPGKDMV